ncbi:uncharacterized protein [Typha angustifolia]|uniref:uncharacterized protein n=1 Tax=Typha angustifolia TaxID=59011 RepID=UPI003C2D70BC
MEESANGGGGGDPPHNKNPSVHKGKSCKGCLYYSSLLKSGDRKPVCLGISRTLPQVPSYVVGESEIEATKDGRKLSEFKYACVGYSVLLDNKDNPSVKTQNRAELPFCVGIELLVDKTTSTAGHAPSHAHKEARSQPQVHKPAHSSGEEFLLRFSRNAGLVASAVARNLHKAGNYVKESVNDMLYPYGRRSK